jgi:uncharacterized membrane protein YccC
MWSEWWNRFMASDPALRRLRTATRVTCAVAANLAIMMPLLAQWGQPLPSVLIGAVVSINSTLAVTDTTDRQRRITTLLMPFPAALSLLIAATVEALPLLSDLLFLVVVFVATYIRRFGPRYSALGLVGFMGYFFAMLLHPTLARVPALVAVALCGALTAFAMRFLILRDDPEGILDRGRRTLRAQVRELLHAVRDVADHPDSAKRRKQLHKRSIRLNETALMLANTVNQLDSIAESGRALLRQRILDVELAAENLQTPLMRIIDHPSRGPAARRALGALLAVLRSDPSEVREATHVLADRLEREESAEIAMTMRRLGAGFAELGSATGELGEPDNDTPPDEDGDEAEPQRPEEDTGLRRPETRSAVQATCAAAMAIVFGELVSPSRWYWAVITAFVVFLTVNSRGELMVRAWQRTAGTMLGVVAGILVAAQMTDDPVAELSLIMVCVFLAFYFAGYSYAVMTFFITTMLGLLYGMMGTFNVGVLETRLAETAVGATAGVVAAALILPNRTHSLVRSRFQEFLLALRDVLRETSIDISSRAAVPRLRESVRDLDDRLQQLLNSAQPLTSYRLRPQRSPVDRSVTVASGCAYYIRNLTVALPRAIEMVDDDTRNRLADLLAALADSAESLTDEATAHFDVGMREAHRHADALHDLAESLPTGPTSLHRAVKLLHRTMQTLEDLAWEFGFAPPPDDRPLRDRRDREPYHSAA